MSTVGNLEAECLRELKERGADADVVTKWELAWATAVGGVGDPAAPLPCPVCFTGGKHGRVTPRPSSPGHGHAKCGVCGTSFHFNEG